MKQLATWCLVVEVALLTVGGAAGWSAGCAAGTVPVSPGDGGVVVPSGSGTPPLGGGISTVAECTPCVTSATCGGGICAQLQGDSFCASSCAAGEGLAACPVGTTCSLETAANGAQVSVCAPASACPGGAPPPPVGSGTGSSGGGVTDSGQSPPPTCVPASSNCGGYDAPTTPSTCSSCSASSSSCQPNGCYGGWFCDATTSRCHAPPSGCSASGGTPTCSQGSGTGTGTGSTGSGSGSLPTSVTGTVTGAGGSVSSLLFAIVGDTRPANIDDTSGYPTTIIETIFSAITTRSPQPSFVVSTGDYQFSSTPPSSGASTSGPQLALFMQARAKYPGAWFPAMGNHECNGYTASNCASMSTTNLTNFISTMLGPINQTRPYYAINVNATDGSWTSKLVFIAANAWDSTQSSWLDTTLAKPTTYTFVLRHEANEASTAPGVSPSEAIVTKYPLTLEICGHTHDYSKSGNHVVFGNGGAPLTGSGDYGYGLVTQRSDGAIVVDEINYQTGAADSSFHFVVTPTGAPTQ